MDGIKNDAAVGTGAGLRSRSTALVLMALTCCSRSHLPLQVRDGPDGAGHDASAAGPGGSGTAGSYDGATPPQAPDAHGVLDAGMGTASDDPSCPPDCANCRLKSLHSACEAVVDRFKEYCEVHFLCIAQTCDPDNFEDLCLCGPTCLPVSGPCVERWNDLLSCTARNCRDAC